MLYCGTVQDGTLEQVKGVTYSMTGFLGPHQGVVSNTDQAVDSCVTDIQYSRLLKTDPANELFYCIIYLGPGDYHRFHSPADWTVSRRRHFPGTIVNSHW